MCKKKIADRSSLLILTKLTLIYEIDSTEVKMKSLLMIFCISFILIIIIGDLVCATKEIIKISEENQVSSGHS